ncbi:hypothetical protein THMIRHAM_09070 [Thiomicrorhabdus immobilis]|uniref:AMMECR1 domain-containing protein n=1 Tax=Thiomicrorhabdus immobilis TaxID=2791037 RepID=A0ABN6CYY7_9GAMM|nr:AmmeMemoRadiSam system protein A [Thiomicrorhabdus immobilis]BCN93122.1 hypothetical protein THMIRHAM_09070 [Thiomicrorhabdus immobilis]
MNQIAENSKQMFKLVKHSIESGLNQSNAMIDIEKIATQTPFDEKLATFVTLHLHGELRGCIGSLQAYQSLAEDLYANAYSAAFRDPRFKPLAEKELQHIEVEISVLTAPEPIEGCSSKDALLEKLTPYKDGLIISDGTYRATFLPSVWEQLPDKGMFVEQLLRKAGIRGWSNRIDCQRYFVESYQSNWLDI